MPEAADLLRDLHSKGVRLWTQDGQLRYQGPAGALLAEDVSRLRALKAEVIHLLRQQESDVELPLAPRRAGCTVPLTAMQKQFWHSPLGKQRGLYKRSCTVSARLLGELDVDLLQECLENVVRRHESLRTRIVTVEGEPVQVVHDAGHRPLAAIDLRPAADAQSIVRQLADECCHEPVDLSRDDLFEARLFQVAEMEHVLILALNHMITDGVSKNLLAKEIWTLYEQGLQDHPVALPAPALQFADFAVWEQSMYPLWLRKHESYWQERLRGAPAIRVPCSNEAATSAEPSSTILQISLGEELSERLREVARRERTLLSLVALTLYVAVMSRWCNERDLIVTLVSNGRERPQLEQMLGFLANAAYLRIESSDRDTFMDLLRRVTQEFNAAYRHQEVGLNFLSAASTELTFNWRSLAHAPKQRAGSLGSTLQVVPLSFRAAMPLKFTPLFAETGTGIEVIVLYRPDLLSRAIVECFGSNLRLCAEELAQRPLTRLSSMRMAWDEA